MNEISLLKMDEEKLNTYYFPILLDSIFTNKTKLCSDLEIIPMTDYLRKIFFGIRNCQFDNRGYLIGCDSSSDAPIAYRPDICVFDNPIKLNIWNSNFLLKASREKAQLFNCALKLMIIGRSGLLQGARHPPIPGLCVINSICIPYYRELPLTKIDKKAILTLNQLIQSLQTDSSFLFSKTDTKLPWYFCNYLKALGYSTDNFCERVTYLIHCMEGLLHTKKRLNKYRTKDLKDILIGRIIKLPFNFNRQCIIELIELALKPRNKLDHGEYCDLITKKLFLKLADLIRNLIVLSLHKPKLFAISSLKNLDE